MNGTGIGRVLGSLAGAALAGAALAETYYYDPLRGSGASWFGATNWSTNGFVGPFDRNWTDGNVACFNFSVTKLVSLADTTVDVGGLLNSNASVYPAFSTPAAAEMTFRDNATVGGGPFYFGWTGSGRIVVRGPFTHTDGTLTLRETAALVGAVTNTGGTITAEPAALSTNSRIEVAGGTLQLSSGIYTNAGAVGVSGSGIFEIGPYNAPGVTATVSRLSGTGGTVQPRWCAAAVSGVINRLVVDQAGASAYSGSVAGVQTFQGVSYLHLAKAGTGDLTLAGTVNLRQGTAVRGGRLLLTGAGTKNTHNIAGGAGADAIQVTGGALGGTATVNVLGGTDVTVAEGGGLVAGLPGTAGRSIYAFESGLGGVLDLSGATASNRWLHFDLGTNTTAGTTYDQVQVTGGTLAIGSGLLSMDDFAFTGLSGLGRGTYVLFNNAALSGTLGSPTTGPVAGGFYGTLRLDGNNIVLDVTPPPGTVVKVW